MGRFLGKETVGGLLPDRQERDREKEHTLEGQTDRRPYGSKARPEEDTRKALTTQPALTGGQGVYVHLSMSRYVRVCMSFCVRMGCMYRRGRGCGAGSTLPYERTQ